MRHTDDAAKMDDTLPVLLSHLMEAAANEAEKLDRKQYHPSSGNWHAPETRYNGQKVCEICVAGALIAGRLKAPADCDVNPDFYNHSIETKLRMLDFARIGMLKSAIAGLEKDVQDAPMIHIEQFDEVHAISSTIENSDFRTWREFDRHLKSLRRAAAQLRKIGF